MSYTYNFYNLEASFKEYLLAGNNKPVSVKNYISDIKHFFGWLTLYSQSQDTNDVGTNLSSLLRQILTSKSIDEYKNYLLENKIPVKTVNRRLSTVRKFCSFCISQGWLKENPAKQISNISLVKVDLFGNKTLNQFTDYLKSQNLPEEEIVNKDHDIKEFMKIINST
jgi:site-specific recombinase XerC